MLRLYDFLDSGNGYKVRLMLSHLGLAYERIELDIMKGETRTPDYLAKNPNGRIPLLELEDGRFLPESNAILFYLAEGTEFLSSDRYDRAETLQWMFFEQYNHEPNIAVCRHWLLHHEMTPEMARELPLKQEKGYAALDVMERHLATHAFFVQDRYGIADIALYAYTHVAHQGGFDLAHYPQIGDWLTRVQAQPGHITIDKP